MIFGKIKSYFLYFLLSVAVASSLSLVYKNWSKSKEIQKLQSDLYRIRVLSSNAVMVAAQKFKFYDKEIRFQANLVAHYKKVIFNFESATQETVFTDSGFVRHRVNFDEKKGTIRVFGHTLTNPPEAYAEVERDPLKLGLEVRREGKNFYTSVLWKSDPDLEIDSLNVKYSGFEERGFFGWVYSVSYNSCIDDFKKFDLKKFEVGVGMRLGSYAVLPSFGATQQSKFKIRISLLKIF